MGPIALVIHRARAGLGLLLTILALSAATTAIIAGTLGYSQAAATVAARQALTDAVPTEAGIRVQTRIAEDPGAQDAAARRIIDEAFAGTDVRVQHTRVSEPRSVTDQEGRLVALASSSLLSGDPEFAERVEVVGGSWPESSDLDGTVPGALHAGAAERWGAGTGDTLEVGGTTVTITALWRAVDPQAAFWFGDPLVASGGTESEVGPLVVHPDAITSLGGTPFVRWTVQPAAGEITPDEMPTLASAASRLQSAMKTPEVDVRGVTVEGDLAPTTATAARNLATAQALNVVPVILLLLVSVIAIVQIARLQSQSRSGEVELLIARGASRGQILRWTLMESVVVAAVATAIGIGAALLVMRFVPAGDQQSATVVRAGLLTGLAVLLALAVIALVQVRSLSARTATDRSGRTRQVAALGTLVLTLGAAALAWWQLRQYGSPLVTEDDGSLSTDLVAGAAPALLLAAAAVVAMALLGPAGRVAESVTRPTRGLAAHLAAGQVSRRLVVYAVPVVLTVLAVGATTVSALYAATSANLRSQLAVLGEGADVRVVLASQPAGGVGEVPPTLDVSDVSGVMASAPVWRTEARLGIGGDPSQVLALPVDRMDEVVIVPEGLDLAGLQDQLRPDFYSDWAALDIPENATELTFDLTVETSLEGGAEETIEDILTANRELMVDQLGTMRPEDVERQVEDYLVVFTFPFLNDHQVTPMAWVEDTRSGRVHAVELDPVGYRFDVTRDGTEITSSPVVSEGRSTLSLPGHGTTQRLLGITLTVPEFGQPFQLDLQITGITADTQPATDLLAGAPDLSWGDPLLEVEQDSEAGALRVRGQVGQSRGQWLGDVAPRPITMLPARPADAADAAGTEPGGDQPSSGVVPVDPEPVPVAVTTALATANNLQVGSVISVNTLGATAEGEVVAVIDAVPGISEPQALMVDSRAYAAHAMPDQRALTAANELWLASSDPQATVEQLSGLPEVATVTGPGSVSVTDAAAAVRLVFWVASTGAVLLAVTGIAAVAAALLGGRRPEVAVLRAIGMTPGGQARSRAAELLGVVALSALLGLGAGWLVGAMVIPELARSTTAAGQASLPALLRLEVAPWATLLGFLVAAMVGLVTVLAWRVRRQALDNEYREEIR